MFWSILESDSAPLHRVGVRGGPNVIAVTPQDRCVHGLGKDQERGRGVHSAVCISDVSPGNYRAVGVVSAAAKTPLRRWNPRPAHIPAGKQTSPTTEPARAEFVGANRLFARLVFHQVRPDDRSADAAKQRIGSSHSPNPGLVSVPALDAKSSFPLRSERSVTTAAASPDPLSAPIETLFSELARRCLRRLAAEERP